MTLFVLILFDELRLRYKAAQGPKGGSTSLNPNNCDL